jgi:DNA-binding CsgD family transcriptional regulator
MDDEVPDDARRVPTLLSAAESVLGDDVSYARTSGSPDSLDEHLSAAIRALSSGVRRQTATDAAVGPPSGALDHGTAREQAILLELGIVRSALRSRGAARRAPVTGMSSLLHVLRSFSSLGDLLDGVPAEIHRVGFGRVLLSRVQAGLWVARSGSVAGNPGLASELVRLGMEYPGTLNGSMIEADVVRRLKPILVSDARGNARVHERLRDLIDCRAYVSAPLLVHGAVAGLIHADQDPRSGTVDSFDRDLLGMVAEGLGFAIERVVSLERLRALRCRLDEHTRTVSDLIDEFVSGEVELSGAVVPGSVGQVSHPRVPAWDNRAGDLGSRLTRREFEVLRRMALGETNVQIAHRLFVSEGTVKSHVKHILRKLEAANRAEAVSRYHLMMRDRAYSSRER